jgi:hypothetical protein
MFERLLCRNYGSKKEKLGGKSDLHQVNTPHLIQVKSKGKRLSG